MATQNNVIIRNNDCKLNDLSNNFNNFKSNGSIDNLTTNNINNKNKIYYDNYTMPHGIGPYQVDAIPILVKDKFKMPKFTANRPTDPYFYSPEQYDTQAYPEMVIFVPSKRKELIATPQFKQSVANECDNLGAFNMSFEDYCLGTGRAGIVGISLNNKVQAFKTAVQDINTTVENRTTLLNNILNDPDYKFLKDNVKLPFKVWDQVPDNSGNFVFDDLLDEKNIPLQNQLLNGSYFKTKMTRSSWPLDNNGNPTELLPIEQNVNACGPIDPITGENTTPLNPNNKMGLFFFNLGLGTSHWSQYSLIPGLVASFGYIVIVNVSHPISSSFANFNSKKTVSKLLADKIIPNFDINDPNGTYYINPNNAYNNEGFTSQQSITRSRLRAGSLSPPAKLIIERHTYQTLCVLRKLGLYNKIDFTNVVHGALSLGGIVLNVIHDLQPTGICSQFTLNNLDGSSSNVKPYLYKIKAMIGWQTIHQDVSNLSNSNSFTSYVSELNRNNRFSVGMGALKVPFIYFTGDGDLYDRIGTGNTYDNLFNGTAQTIFQLTKLSQDSNVDQILANSMVIYKPVTGHSPAGYKNDLYDGMVSNIYPAYNWLDGGHKFSQYAQWPSISNIAESGFANEDAYRGYEDYKTQIAIQLAAHRFLGIDYPVNTQAFSSLGWRVDLMPTHCDILTEYEYLRVGPTSYISYDVSYNIVLETNKNKASLAVDISNNLVSNVKGLILKSEDGTKTYKLSVDNNGNLKIVLV